MRIGIDARFFGPRVGGGGLGRYVAELVTHLQKIDTKNTYVLFLRKENFHDCVITNPNFEKRLVDAPWYSLAEQLTLPREVRLARVNFMHYPHWNVPLCSRVPFIVTIHDLIMVEDPSSAHATTRNAVLHGVKHVGFRLALEHAVHRSRHIITVSEHARQSILGHFRIPPQKVTVIANGIIAPSEGKSVVLRDMGVYPPYFLYVGNRYPHKNLEVLLEAFAEFHKGNVDVQLVLAGKDDAFTDRLRRRAQQLGIAQRVKFLHLPSDEELGALYRNATLFVYPSRYEGFGMPPLEAMRARVPVVVSNATSLPEVVGVHAAQFDPDDVDALVGMMNRAVHGTLMSDDAIAAADRYAQQFSWEKTAKKTLETYLAFGARRL